MKIKTLFTLLLLGSMGWLCPNIGMSEIIGGGLANASSPGSSALGANLLYSSMDAVLALLAEDYKKKHKCAPADYFLKQADSQTNIIQSVTNGNNCDVIGRFSQQAPGDLKGRTVRIVVKISGADSNIDFDFRETITDVNNGHNGFEANFFQNPTKSYQWAPTLQSSFFGNAASAPTWNVLNDDYETIATLSDLANPINNSNPTPSSRHTTTIG